MADSAFARNPDQLGCRKAARSEHAEWLPAAAAEAVETLLRYAALELQSGLGLGRAAVFPRKVESLVTAAIGLLEHVQPCRVSGPAGEAYLRAGRALAASAAKLVLIVAGAG